MFDNKCPAWMTFAAHQKSPARNRPPFVSWTFVFVSTHYLFHSSITSPYSSFIIALDVLMQKTAPPVTLPDPASTSPVRHHYTLPATPPGSEDGELPRLDRIPVEVLSLVASLISPPFYLEPPPETASPTPQPNVIASLDPAPQPEQTFAQALSSTTKTCSHVLEAARPWMWEDVNVRSGRGWLAVVDALTEEVVDDIAVDEQPMSGAASTVSEPLSQPMSPILAPAYENALATGSSSSGAPRSGASVHFSTDITGGQSINLPLPVSVPVGTGHGRNIVGRNVTINTEVAKAHYQAGEPSSSRSPSSSCTSPPPAHRVGQLLTPPGSRATSPNAAQAHYARLRGRSRSPRRHLARNVTFDTEGISSVLQRSLSMSLPAGKRPFMRQSSLSHSRVVRECESEDEEDTHNNNNSNNPDDFDPYEAESLRAAMRTPPKEEEEPAANAGEESQPNVNPDLLPPPGPYIRHLSFTNFRTIGSRRSQDEAVRGRFVTAGRLEGVIKNTPNLRSLCMTEYVDSALSYPVLEEIFFRGYSKPRIFHRQASLSPAVRRGTRSSSNSNPPADLEPAQTTMDDQIDPPRPEYVPYEDETEDDKWSRRKLFTPLEAIDLTGCVSGAFTDAINEFGENWLNLGTDDNDEERGRSRGRRFVTESTGSDDEHLPLAERRTHRPLFTGLRRLSLRACTRLHSQFLTHLILAMPNLTHLDLSGTRVSDSLLIALTQRCPPGMQLESLSLARCPRLDPSCVVDFLIECPAAHSLVELNLFVNPTQGNAIQGYDLARLLREAPCFKSGRLRYLDLSSAGFTAAHLAPDVFPPQPSLVSFGLSYVPHLSLRDIGTFLQGSAPGVEILTLTGSAIQDLRPDASTLQITLTLHTLLINPLTTLPFSISGLDLSGSSRKVDLSAGPTRLRVVELSSAIRRSLDSSQGSGRSNWQVVRSKGGRGWYVDVSAGWIPHDTIDDWGYVQGEPESVGEGLGKLSFVRRLPGTHPRRRWLTSLAEANGRVRSAVGWHSRKMEVVRGEGMMGREEGMGGVGAFAFEE